MLIRFLDPLLIARTQYEMRHHFIDPFLPLKCYSFILLYFLFFY